MDLRCFGPINDCDYRRPPNSKGGNQVTDRKTNLSDHSKEAQAAIAAGTAKTVSGSGGGVVFPGPTGPISEVVNGGGHGSYRTEDGRNPDYVAQENAAKK